MQGFSALKLLDRSILPVVILVGVKLLAVFLFSLILGYNWVFSFYPSTSRILMFVFENNSQVKVLSNLSDFLMVLTAAFFFAWKLFKAENLTEESVHPSLLLKLYETGREFFVSPSVEIYHDVSVWFSLAWFCVFVVSYNVLAGSTSLIVLGLAVAIALTLSTLLWQQLTSSKG